MRKEVCSNCDRSTMNNVLLSCHCYRGIHSWVMRELGAILSNQFKVTYYDENVLYNKIDAVICLNVLGYEQVKRNVQDTTLSIIYFFCKSDIVEEYPYDYSTFDRIIMIEDTHDISCGTLDMFEFLYKTPIPMDVSKSNRYLKQRSDISDRITFILQDKFMLLKWLPLVNSISNTYHKVCLLSKDKPNSNCLSSTVTWVGYELDRLAEICYMSRIVLTNRECSLFCIRNGVPTLIIGEGYGGLVSNDNIKEHYYASFNGDTTDDNCIPYPSISQDINMLLCEKDLDRSPVIKLCNEVRNTSNTILSIVNDVINHKKVSCRYFFNEEDYDLALMPNGRCLVFNIVFKNVQFEVDLQGHQIIVAFSYGRKIEEVSEFLGVENDHAFQTFIYELIDNKILVSEYVKNCCIKGYNKN